jgi:NitT/TauT family transport system permease protein
VNAAHVPAASLPRRFPRAGRRILIRLGQIGVILLVVLIWALVTGWGLLNESVLPSVAAVAVELVGVLFSPEFWANLGATLLSAFIGFVIALVVGVVAGLLLGTAPPARRATQVVLDFGRSFPVIALLPLISLILGTNKTMETCIIAIALVWPILTQTIDGSKRIDPVIADTVSAYRIGRMLRFWKVVVPNAAPYLATGIRIAATASLLIALAIEILTMLPGIGGQIARAQQYQAPALALAYVILIGAVAMVLNWALSSAEGRLLAWSRRAVAR